MKTDKLKVMLIGTAALALVGCGAPGGTTTNTSSVPVTTTTSSASGYGVVQAIDMVQRDQAQVGGIGLGTIAGAVVGGALGNQVGSGSGRTAATIAGAAGGAYAGNKMQQNARSADQVYRVTLRMDNGSMQTLAMENSPGLQIGDRVRVDNGVIVERMR